MKHSGNDGRGEYSSNDRLFALTPKTKWLQAQSFAEYAVVIALSAAALLGMRVFIVRTMQEKFRSSADVFGGGEQYVRGATVTTSLDGPLTNLTNPPFHTSDCSFVLSQIVRLETGDEEKKGEITILRRQADNFDLQASEMEAQAQILFANDMPQQAEQILVSARSLRAQAAISREEAQNKQDEADRLRNDYSDCFL